MNIDYNKPYFRMSVNFNAKSPEEFGFSETPDKDGTYIDSSKWIPKNLYDFGWDEEFGMMRLPKLEFKDLWLLLIKSNNWENQYGAAHLLLTEYPDMLLDRMIRVFTDPDFKFTPHILKVMQILKLNEGNNKSTLLNKDPSVIESEAEKWQWLKSKLDEILSQFTSNNLDDESVEDILRRVAKHKDEWW
jgi:hypothetical protein